MNARHNDETQIKVETATLSSPLQGL